MRTAKEFASHWGMKLSVLSREIGVTPQTLSTWARKDDLLTRPEVVRWLTATDRTTLATVISPAEKLLRDIRPRLKGFPPAAIEVVAPKILEAVGYYQYLMQIHSLEELKKHCL